MRDCTASMIICRKPGEEIWKKNPLEVASKHREPTDFMHLTPNRLCTVSVENCGNQIIKESLRISDIVKGILHFQTKKQNHSYSSVYDIIENALS